LVKILMAVYLMDMVGKDPNGCVPDGYCW
jgi:hypothetical protein